MSEKLPIGQRPEPKEVGDDKEKAAGRKTLEHLFGEHHNRESVSEKARAFSKAHEIPKSAVDLRSIELANELTNKMLVELGLPAFDVPERNIYFFDSNALPNDAAGDGIRKKFERSPAITLQLSQGILLDVHEIRSPIARAAALLHEIIHLKNALTVKSSLRALDLPQMGLQVMRRRNRRRQFVGLALNESIVAEIERRFLPFLLAENEELATEANATYDSTEALRRREAIARNYHIPYDEVVYAGTEKNDFELLGYNEARETIWFVVSSIADRAGVHSEDVWPYFLRAEFTGDINTLRDLVDDTFGRGAYRILEHMHFSRRSATRAGIKLKTMLGEAKDQQLPTEIKKKYFVG